MKLLKVLINERGWNMFNDKRSKKNDFDKIEI